MMLMPNQELWVGTHKDVVIYNFDTSSKTLTPTYRLLSHSRKVNCLLVVKGEEMWSGSDDGTICIWSIATKELIRVLTTRSGAIRNLVQVDGNTVWSGQAQNSIIIWDIRVCTAGVHALGWSAADVAPGTVSQGRAHAQ